ncbi:O-antigen ligase family protein [Candidatus Woesearchaeota archaeon]|nr:O-antigen ligase family protein [Candidatus Woesearchaeota archaeon]
MKAHEATENERRKNRPESLSPDMIILAIGFVIGCFIDKHVLFLFPALALIVSIMRYNKGLELVLYVSGINFGYLFFAPGEMGGLNPNAFITVGQIIFLLVGFFKIKQIKLDKNTVLFLIFTLISASSLLYTSNLFNGVKVLANIAQYLLTLMIFYNIQGISREKIMKIIVVSALISILVVYPIQILQGDNLFLQDNERGGRFSGGAVHPVPLALFFSLAFYAALYLYDKYRQKKYLLMELVAIAFTLATITRAAILGLFVTIIAYVYYKNKLKYILPVAVIMVIAFAGPISEYAFKQDARYAESNLNYISSGRINLWKESLSVFDASPLTGTGVGSSIDILEKFDISVPHNDFIRVLLEVGIIGFAVFITFTGMQGLRVWMNAKENAVLACMFIFFIITMITDSQLDYNLYYTFPFFILLGLENRILDDKKRIDVKE